MKTVINSDCKSVYTGSIPVPASNISKDLYMSWSIRAPWFTAWFTGQAAFWLGFVILLQVAAALTGEPQSLVRSQQTKPWQIRSSSVKAAPKLQTPGAGAQTGLASASKGRPFGRW
jgi:hypothetical protein